MSDTSEKRLMFIHALTGLHPGSGTALGVVDLPVQRERHTQWPTIPGSTLKGVLRDACREQVAQGNGGDRKQANKADVIAIVFGPDSGEADKHAGAISLTDARILAFPVRSLRGVFAWVTCPAVLERLDRDLKLLVRSEKGLEEKVPDVRGNKALCASASPLLVDDNKLVLEEFEFEHTGDAPSKVLDYLSGAASDDATKARIMSHLVVLNDDDFNHFVRHATEVAARIGLDYDKKTVKSGALFYEEFLPPETIFYSVVIATDSRKNGNGMKADAVLTHVTNNMPPVLQIGADETIGKGLCAVTFSNGGAK